MNTSEFINKANQIHNNVYDYSLVNYKNNKTKVKIICPEHGIFEQRPDAHTVKKCGCLQCANKNKSIKYSSSKEEFVKQANQIHKSIYDYSLVEYKNNKTKVKIICPKHGIFEQRPDTHTIKKCGCLQCAINKKISSKEEFINKANQIHNNVYDYSLVNYKNNKTKIKIICPKHGMFEQQPTGHINNKQGCPRCYDSKGEKEIANFLKLMNINYIRNFKFNNCKNIKLLSFDFYLPNYNICIEYDGIQHFKPIKFFGGKSSFILLRKRDAIKTKYCLDNNIKLIRIDYNENIQNKLNYILF